MKKITILLALMIAATFTFAQAPEGNKSNYPYWTISKDVQRLQFRNETFQPAIIKVGNAMRLSSKGISYVAMGKRQSNQTVVKMTGTPSQVFSKGIARIQR